MKTSFFLLLIIFLTLEVSHAQQVDNYRQDTTTLYQRAKGFSSDPIRSKWRQQVKQEGGAWTLYLYDKKDVLQEKISFADKSLLERKGAYARYKDGNVKEEGRYEKGYKVGEWKRYYANKQVAEKMTYTWDKLNGPSLSYWDNGAIKANKHYMNGLKVGECKLFYKNGKLALNEVYDENGKVLTGAYFDQEGKAVDLAYVMKLML